MTTVTLAVQYSKIRITSTASNVIPNVIGLAISSTVVARRERITKGEAIAWLVGERSSPRQSSGKRVKAIYSYRDENGSELFQVVRFDPKDFRQRQSDGNGGYTWSTKSVRKVLYNLRDILQLPADQWAFVVEGERDADRLQAHSLTATTNPGGSGKWHLVDSSPLYGKRVAIIPDFDAAGEKHAIEVAESLHGKAAEVRIVRLLDVPEKGDVSDWLDAGHAVDELMLLIESSASYSAAEPTKCIHEFQTRAVIVRASDVVPQPVKWLWKHRIPLGKISALSGWPDVGKSVVTIDLAARVSSGASWPDHPDEKMTPGGVVLLSAEDDCADTVVPRLIAAGADLKRVTILQGVEYAKGKGKSRSFSLNDLEALEDAIRRTDDCRLAIVDPVTAYLNGIDGNDNPAIRALMTPLARLAANLGVAVVLVSHLRKNGSGPAISQTMGALSFIAAPRAAWLCVRDRADPEQRLFLRQKINIARETPGLAYRIVPSAHDSEIPVIQWDPKPVEMTADEALNGPASERAPRLTESVAWLRDLLSNGPLLQRVIEEAAKKGGIKWRTVQRAKSQLRIDSRRVEGGWEWSLPASDDPEPAEERQIPKSGAVGGVGALGKVSSKKTTRQKRCKSDRKTVKAAKAAKSATIGKVGAVED